MPRSDSLFRRAARWSAGALVLALSAGPVAAQDDAPAAVPDLTNDQIRDRLFELVAARPGAARVLPLGATAGSRDVHALVLASPDQAQQPLHGWVVAGGLDGRRPADATVVLALAEELLADEPGLLGVLGPDRALVLVPRANPDGARALLGQDGPVHERAGNGRPDDADRDARTDEDGPADLDGDGLVTWMRVPDGAGTWVIDEHDPRAMRQAKRAEGERGTHRLLVEARDADGDGDHGEDGTEGVRPDRNFPHRFTEQDARSGAYPLSEPEAMNLARLLLESPGLLGVFVIGPQDTLVSLPPEEKNPRRGGWRNSFTAPFDGMLGDDVGTLEELQRRFEASRDEKHETKADALPGGSFVAWAYHQLGRWPVAVKPWEAPEKLPDPSDDSGAATEEQTDAPAADPTAEGPPAPDAQAADDGAAAEADAGDGSDADEADDAAADDDDDTDDAGADDAADDDDTPKPTSDPESPVPAAVLAWLDREHDGEGIVPWTAFDHPDLGPVEIGGLVPGTLHDMPGAVADAFGRSLAPFVLELVDAMPRVTFEDVEVESAGDGLFRVSAALVNTGVLPTHSSFGAQADLQRPIRVRAALPDGGELLNGPVQTLVGRLEGAGGREELRWVVSARPGARLLLEADADTVADVELELELR